MIQATKNKEESCSFLDAIGRRSCGPLSGLAKNRHVEKPKLRPKRIETAGRYATVRFVTLPMSSDLHFNSPSSLACFSSACTPLGMLPRVHKIVLMINLLASARCPEDKESTKSKTETAESVDAGPSRIEGQERGAGAQSKKSKKAKTKKKKKKVGTGIGTSTSARVLRPRTGRLN